MVIKMDESLRDNFIKSGKKLISEYVMVQILKEDEEQKPQLLNEEVLLS